MDFHGQIMNIRMLDDISIASVVTDGGNIEPSAVHCYKTGHHDARHAAAKVAAEADQRIAELEAQLAAANARIAELETVFGEFGESDGKCKDCGSPVVLVAGSTNWNVSEFRPPGSDSLCPSGAAFVSTDSAAPSGGIVRGW